MDYHLQNVRTGETHALNPQRTLIGTAEHATIPTTEAGPYLAALLVKYADGWVVHGLSDDPGVTFNRAPLGVGQQVGLKKGDLLVVGEDRFSIVSPHRTDAPRPEAPDAPPACFVFIRNPDGMEECRVVDHDLLFGRLAVCHVQIPDTRLSRLAALLAAHAGEWYVHVLSKKPIARNRRLVEDLSLLEDGDELQIGPLGVRVEIRAASDAAPSDGEFGASAPPLELAPAATDLPDSGVDTSEPDDPSAPPDRTALMVGAIRLEQWLKAQHPTPAPQSGGISGWLGAQRDKLRRFWYDTPETTTARGLRASGKVDDAFAVLDRAIRARPDSPELLRELYRLYEAVGFADLCFRPLRHIEKLAAARGTTDTWVLETLARLCLKLSKDRAAMFDRAIAYWNKLEAATGVSYARERASASAARALRDGGFSKSDHAT